MRIDSSGAVGIGTDSPAVKLEIAEVSSAPSSAWAGGTDFLKLTALAGSSFSEPSISFQEVGSNIGAKIGVKNKANGAYEIVFANRDNSSQTSALTERMRIETNGNVKINSGALVLSNDGGWVQYDATWVRSVNNKGVFNASTAATAFATPGDFSAGYSDMRLKTHLGTIPDALDKVCSLEGFYYERNDKAVELGYAGGERRVGLSAQDVQAVLPEVVKDAPINIDNGTDYLTIDYERVVPLLVEAIKAQQIQIDELKRNQK